MDWITKLFSGGVSEVVDSLGTAIDKLVTSDEERLKVKAAVAKEMNTFKAAQLAALAEYDKEVTQRHTNDMKSDSWLSKNIRPLTLAFMSVTVMGLAYSTIFLLDREDVVLVQPWLSVFMVLLGTIYAFYFGSRGAEKIQAHRGGGKQ